MKDTEKRAARPGFWRALRLAGVLLAAAPVIFMLLTGAVGSLAARRPLLDVLLPAELAFITLPGMALIPLAAAREQRRWGLSAALAALGAAAFAGCLGMAWLSGIAGGASPAAGPAWWITLALLALFDLCAAAAPVAGLLAARPVEGVGALPAQCADECATRWPILLVHGTGFRDWGYWGRVPKALEARGARVFYGGQDGWATVEKNAAFLRGRVLEILEQTGSEKLHIIAHSKGGLDVRCMVSSLGMAPCVASVSLVSTPNHGSRTMDALSRMPRWVFRLGGFFVNLWYRLLGDRHPDFCSVCDQFTTGWAEAFNRANPDASGVLYRSYAGAMSCWRSDVFMWWQNLIIGLVEGENDGLVAVWSARWTGFRGVWRGAGSRGVSHMDEVDFRRRPIKRRGERFDVVEQYIQMVAELKEKGM
ncbi:MAG TPA: hypothetical protein H9795_07425 [Candidatus Fournierella merdigallinarum]|nr:hypothetical protein [Candidatus Fournierella merdigallinarum]